MHVHFLKARTIDFRLCSNSELNIVKILNSLFLVSRKIACFFISHLTCTWGRKSDDARIDETYWNPLLIVKLLQIWDGYNPFFVFATRVEMLCWYDIHFSEKEIIRVKPKDRCVPCVNWILLVQAFSFWFFASKSKLWKTRGRNVNNNNILKICSVMPNL